MSHAKYLAKYFGMKQKDANRKLIALNCLISHLIEMGMNLNLDGLIIIKPSRETLTYKQKQKIVRQRKRIKSVIKERKNFYIRNEFKTHNV